MKRIAFIEPRSPGAHIFSRFPIPRLGAPLLGTILRDHGYDVRIFVEDIAEIEWTFLESSDLVCISTITSTAPRAYYLAGMIRKRGIPVLMGGAHPTFMPEEALKYADYVVRGEADRIILPLIEAIENGWRSNSGGYGLQDIKGISYRDSSGRIYHNPSQDLLDDLDILPTPDMSLVYGFKSDNIYPISTSRGCPFDCRFCSVIQMFGRRYRYRSVEKTLEDIRNALRLSKGTIFFVDDNFSANKERTKEILRRILLERLELRWSAQVRVDVARDEELLKLMADSGCHTLYIGFESINPETLRFYNKRQEIKEIIDGIKKIKEYGIHIHGMFVLGADTDNLETIRDTVDFARRLHIDTVQFLILTPLPGTPLFVDMDSSGRLIHRDWSKYDAHHVVFRPAGMGIEDLQVETLLAMKRFYSWKYIIRHLLELDIHYVIIGFYARRLLKEALSSAEEYLTSLGLTYGEPMEGLPL